MLNVSLCLMELYFKGFFIHVPMQTFLLFMECNTVEWRGIEPLRIQ
jgi:hypothetical protein